MSIEWIMEGVDPSKVRLFNTAIREKESLHPLREGELTLYTCGPTVYNFAHIGNFRTYLFEDLLRRTLEFFGWRVRQVMNLTDVDDKTIKGAIREGVTLEAFTKPYIEAFFEDLEALRIQPASSYPKATDYIPQMIELIHCLLKKGVAYGGNDGSIYYSIAKFPRYGALSHLKLDELKVGAGEGALHDEYEKESASDFVLWKAYDPDRDGGIFWESPFGKGRPGWHLECSAMAVDLLGDEIDIHVGGVDNIFPHHENEIAQSEACTGKCFVRHWMHADHLIVDGKKMSKSAGNFFTIRDLFAKGFSGDEVRYALLQTHYRIQLNFKFDEIEAVRASLERLNAFVRRLKGVAAPDGEGRPTRRTEAALKGFAEGLADDLNISSALAALFDWLRETNSLLDMKKVSAHEARAALDLLTAANRVLGFITFDEPPVPPEIEQLLRCREEARLAKNWAEADRCRGEVLKRGYLIEDTPKGPQAIKQR